MTGGGSWLRQGRRIYAALVGEGTLSIQLLGQFGVRRGDVQLSLESRRAESLVAWLLLHRDGPQSRQRLAFLLWPDSTEAQALTNLRHALHSLRRAQPDIGGHLEVTTRTLRWRDDRPYRLDVADFESALADGAWQAAVDAYSGDLLAGRTEEWVDHDRDRLRRRYLDALQKLVTERARDGDPDAVRHAERLLREQPLREETYRLLMGLYDARGDRARAVRVYHECAATLERELGVEPAAATRAAYDALLTTEDFGGVPGGRLGGPPFVGRTAERATLATAWREVRTGSARMVLVAGEPGIGKTRLAEVFRSWCAHRGAVTATARAYPGGVELAYQPVITWLRSAAFRQPVLMLARPLQTELARLLPELASAVPGLAAPERLPESEQRRRLYDAVGSALVARGGPVLLVADDIQWWDRESVRLLHHVLLTEHLVPFMVIATARGEDIESAPGLGELLLGLRTADLLTVVDLERLDRAETAQLVERLEVGHAGADIASLYRQTEGVPLFVVEALRAGWRPGRTALTPRAEAVIESRLAQLSGPARELVDIAATVGREFTAGVVASAGRLPEETAVRGLDELWRRRIIKEHDATAYDFSHDKLREVAYAALSPVRRRYLHAQVSRALEALHRDDLASVSAQLAHHHEAAGATAEAVAAYARAADAAQRLYAHTESVRLLTRALELLPALPPSPERSATELELSTALLAPLVAVEGYASRRIHDAHDRASVLSRSLGVEPAPPLLRSLGLAGLAKGDFAAARAYGTALRERGERDDDDVLRVEAEYLLGVAAFWTGELSDSRRHLESAVAAYRDENRAEHLLRYAQDPRVVCLTRLALACWHLGDPQAAIRARDRGLAVAEEIGHPYTLMVGLQFASLLALDMDDIPALRRYVAWGDAAMPSDARVQLAGGMSAFDAYLQVVDGGSSDDAVAQIQRILADAPRDGQAAPGLRSVLLRILLAACAAAGDTEKGLAVAEELIGLTNSVVWRPEAERLRSRFLAMRNEANA